MELLPGIPSTLIENFFVKVDVICIGIQLMIFEERSCDICLCIQVKLVTYFKFSSDLFIYLSPELDFASISINSMDATGQRDFVGMYNNAAKII